MQVSLNAIPGVNVVQLRPHQDARGAFTELYRDVWEVGIRPTQWNADHSFAGTLRGVHAHKRRYDYVSVLWGSMILALHDARQTSPTFGRTCMIELGKHDGKALVLPPGVAHAFYFPKDSVTLIGFSCGWDAADDIRCHYSASELNISWPGPIEHISSSDNAAPFYGDFLNALGRI